MRRWGHSACAIRARLTRDQSEVSQRAKTCPLLILQRKRAGLLPCALTAGDSEPHSSVIHPSESSLLIQFTKRLVRRRSLLFAYRYRYFIMISNTLFSLFTSLLFIVFIGGLAIFYVNKYAICKIRSLSLCYNSKWRPVTERVYLHYAAIKQLKVHS